MLDNNKILKEIHIVFENCEVCELNINEVHSFHIGGVSKMVTIGSGNVIHGLVADTLIIWLNKETVKNVTTDGFTVEEYKTPILKRLKEHNDISHIDLIYTDGTNDYINVWMGYEQYRNIGQSYYDNGESVRIMIEKTQQI